LARSVTDPKLKQGILTQSLQAARTFGAGERQEKK
jgi:hypothetical protein